MLDEYDRNLYRDHFVGYHNLWSEYIDGSRSSFSYPNLQDDHWKFILELFLAAEDFLSE